MTLSAVKPELIEIIFTYSQNSTEQLHKYIENLKLNTLSFNDLEWRVDFKLASRSLRKLVEPEIMLKLDLVDGSNDNKKWTLIDSKKNIFSWEYFKNKKFTINHANHYRFYRFNFTKSNNENILRIYKFSIDYVD